jgi:hypothetical protein
MTTSQGLPTILATTAAALLLAACGGGSANDNPSADHSDDAKRVAYLTCLRKAGVKVHEETGAGGGLGIEAPRGISEARMREIERDCARKTGGGPGSGPQLSKAQQAEQLDQALKFSRCMRAHGVNMSDPKVVGNGIRVGIEGSGGKPDGPAFQRAQRACASLMPRKPGAPKGTNIAGGTGGKVSK